MNNPAGSVYCAVDTTDLDGARALVRKLRGQIGGIKLGLEFFVAHGPAAVRQVAEEGGLPLFLDLKFHDIPNTVAGAVRAALAVRPAFLTIHTSGGSAMMRAAVEVAHSEAARLGIPRPRLLGVTVLTSLTDRELWTVGQATPVGDQVLKLATLARDSGVDGVVCSPHEIELLRARLGPELVIMVPGIRPARSFVGDQQRVLTPAEAKRAGADYLVIGRPITQDKDPAAAAARIVAELAAA